MAKDETAPARLSIALGQCSSAGRKAENQDFHGALLARGGPLEMKGIALAVADGVSSSARGRQAAETAVASLMTDYYSTPDAWSVRRSATSVISATNAWLHGRNLAGGTVGDDAERGLVCTLTALILKGREGHVFHVGDSRVSRLSGRSLEPLTEDHLVHASAAERWLARAMGARRTLEIDHARFPLEVGDVFLLTTDGVHDHLDGRAVARIVAEAPDLDAAARAVVAEALERGSPDNLTVQVLRIESLPPEGRGLASDLPALPPARPPRPGEEIDGLRILRELHASDRSHVFLAVDAAGRRAALKVPSTEHAADRAWLARFGMEEWIARRLSSPHLLRAAEIRGPRRSLYVAMEFVEGRSLRQWMTDRPRADLDRVRDLVGQIALGLRAMHRREMIHQDLRPENVMIDDAGTARIIDYGSTLVAGVEEAAPGVLGEMPGTLQYTAPEHLSGDPVSWRSDQYALGVIAYEMLTGRLPYGAQAARVRNRRDQARLVYRPARDDDAGVPAWIDAALRKATHPDPLRRYDALSEFLEDLRRPGPAFRAGHPVPLIARNPVRFWQGLSALLATLCIALAAGLGG